MNREYRVGQPQGKWIADPPEEKWETAGELMVKPEVGEPQEKWQIKEPVE